MLGYGNIDYRMVRFDVILFSAIDAYKVFHRLHLHKDFASLTALVFVDLCQYISPSSISFLSFLFFFIFFKVGGVLSKDNCSGVFYQVLVIEGW